MTYPGVRRHPVGAVGLLATVAVSGCAGVGPDRAPSPVPRATVERFLEAADGRELDAMAQLFGTEDGPIGDTGSTFHCLWKKVGSWFGGESCLDRSDVELRLDAIARVLHHRDYRIGGDEDVAGRGAPTRRIFVDLTLDDGGRVNHVPFETVRGSDGRWYVERVDLERVMSAGGA